MSGVRILHVDDEPDIREIVNISLSLNPDFELRACSSGTQALTAAAEWLPFLVLLDVMMPGMDGPATLAQLRANPQSADLPVLFMTARAQTKEIEHFIALGAEGVISKPFDPMTLGALVLSHLQAIPRDTMRGILMRRAKSDAALLKPYSSRLTDEPNPAVIDQVREIASGLAGAADLAGFDEIGGAARAVENAAATADGGSAGATRPLHEALEQLIIKLETDWNQPFAAVA
jgi:CheY-like chemotaxis protein